MMFKLFAGLIVGSLLTLPALAQNPDEIAARCLNAMQQVVDRDAAIAAEETHECVRRINALQEAGRQDAARQVARTCLTHATERSQQAAQRIRRICHECVEVLVRLGAPELARRVERGCEQAIEQLRHILQRQRNAIEQALAT